MWTKCEPKGCVHTGSFRFILLRLLFVFHFAFRAFLLSPASMIRKLRALLPRGTSTWSNHDTEEPHWPGPVCRPCQVCHFVGKEPVQHRHCSKGELPPPPPPPPPRSVIVYQRVSYDEPCCGVFKVSEGILAWASMVRGKRVRRPHTETWCMCLNVFTYTTDLSHFVGERQQHRERERERERER